MSPEVRCLTCLAWPILLGACIEPDYGSAPFLCAKTGRCPGGFSCVGGVCLRGTPDMLSVDHQAERDAGDAALDLPDLAPLDTPRPDAWPSPGTWKALSAGSFEMGSPSSEPCRDSDETQHKVTLTRGFWIMTTEVTRTMYQSIRGYLPAGQTGCASCPVTQVTWHEAAAYCNALSTKAGLTACYSCSGADASVTCGAVFSGAGIYDCPGYRLPTEAEWEYACRAGTTTALHNGPLTVCSYFASEVDPIAWFSDNSGDVPHAVATKTANPWGLHDMSGNAFEWCHDRYSATLGSTAVTNPVNTSGADACNRGGSYGSWPRYVRSANRGFQAPESPTQFIGLRCVRTRP
jgi:formylglycine-generating enzyme required for sulfatase activity